jgi:hypothetical protein
LPSEEISEIRKKFYNSFYSPRYIFRQTSRGYLGGNYYSKIMARTAINHMLWRVKSIF